MSGDDVGVLWQKATKKLALLEFIDICLRGSGQVIFMNNPLSGLLNFIAMFWGAIHSNHLSLGIGAVLGVMVSTASAYALKVDRAKLKMGLYGFNGLLVGCALPTFLAPNPLMWIFLVLAAMVSTVVMLAISNIMDTWNAPTFTFPYVLTTLLVMLSAYAFPHIVITGMPRAVLVTQAPVVEGAPTIGSYIEASLTSVAQVWFINNPVSGVIFLIGLLVESAWCGILAWIGALVAVGSAWLFGANLLIITNGLWGYNAVLTAVAIGCVFINPGTGSFLYAMLATVFTVIAQGAVSVLFEPVGIVPFTLPYVLTAWLFLLAQRSFENKK